MAHEHCSICTNPILACAEYEILVYQWIAGIYSLLHQVSWKSFWSRISTKQSCKSDYIWWYCRILHLTDMSLQTEIDSDQFWLTQYKVLTMGIIIQTSPKYHLQAMMFALMNFLDLQRLNSKALLYSQEVLSPALCSWMSLSQVCNHSSYQGVQNLSHKPECLKAPGFGHSEFWCLFTLTFDNSVYTHSLKHTTHCCQPLANTTD